MRPEAVLGFDPAPGDPTAVDRLAETLHKLIRALVESRASLDALGPAGSVWEGPTGAPVAALVRRYSLQLGELEEALVGCRSAVDEWRLGLADRNERTGDLVERIADLADEEDAAGRREELTSRARDLEAEHQRAARDLALSFEQLSATVERLSSGDQDLADELDAAVRAMVQAVEEWVATEGPELIRTAVALGEVAALTTVISELVGVAALDRAPGDGAGVRDIISRSPGAHRLIKALHQRWLEVAPALPEATFERDRRTELADAIAGRLAGDQAEA